ncbi:MAG: VCBS repeat-containing protein, partial [Verrucomicrobiaceae bacterium]
MRGERPGPLGIGWSLSGLSVITRCSPNDATEGVRRGVKYMSVDRFCLDGQKLILTDSVGQPVPQQTGYGAPNSEYRLERDITMRIRAYGGTSSTGPAYFKVWAKSGMAYEYGNDAGARVPAVGGAKAGATIAWPVTRYSDASGNFMSVKYWVGTTTFAGGAGVEWGVTEIRYTGNGTQAPTSRVAFNYEAKNDPYEAYHEGAKSNSTFRLANVATFASTSSDGTGGTPVLTHTLNYGIGPNTGRSILQSVQTCSAGAVQKCLPKTTFTYSSGPGASFNARSSPTGLGTLQTASTAGDVGILTGDFNGDGRQDIIRWTDNRTDNVLVTSTGLAAFASPAATLTSTQLGHSNECSYSVVADFNADGISDILQVSDPESVMPTRSCAG